ncbi:dihydroxyacetone kinase family protein [Dermabacter sp. p3-SID358]|uniref:dihydroxyacetone kinase family protein n=1 Tax=Dermabacter sp. p3-SID358 TaxID=2916114 RepID=UPI0021A33EAB|nr:dihydroxyacetone kinase family protein [Dermabacter sp. p3-SID358]MCT1866420.1 dihydroxyacetone kinase family protein [Dermabacter sp. p3-SID358]
MRKIINSPENFVDEVIDGILLAHGDKLRAADADRRAIVRTDAGTRGKVGIVTGGGSGHLPLFLGYVGHGLASGVAVGNVFSSPSPEQIHAATVASDDGAGVLYLYGNYGGDVYTFDLAADMCEGDGIRTRTVLGTDDLLSAPPERAETRRGVAGLFFTYKTAGAAAERGDDLDTVAEIAQRTCDRTRTMGVGLSPTILPAAGEPTFTLDDGEMEIGIGIHGEPGQHRGPLETADEITDRFTAELLRELPVGEGDKVAVLVNGLGATPLEELYVIYRRLHATITERGAQISHVYIGEYATSLEMAGASVSLCHLDDELAELLSAPADSPFFEQAAGSAGEANTEAPGEKAKDVPATRASTARDIATVENPGPARELLLAVTDVLPSHADELRALDAALGDGDLGITVSSGARAVHEALAALPENAAIHEVLRTAGSAFASANPSTFAALLGGGTLAAATAVAKDDEEGDAPVVALSALISRIAERGGAEIGDKTVLDVLDAVLHSFEESAEQTLQERIDRAVHVARDAVEKSASLPSRRGRAAWVGERSIGHKDPGQVAALRFLEALAATVHAN